MLHRPAYTFQACFPTTSGAVIGGNQTVGGDPQFAFVAAFDPTGAHLLYSTLFGDYEFQVHHRLRRRYVWHRGRGGCQRLLLSGRRDPGQQPADHRRRRSAHRLLLWATRQPMCRPGAASLRSSIPSLPPVEHRWPTPPTLAGKPETTGDFISGIAIDSASNAYIVGYTNSKDFPVTSGAYRTVCGPNGQTCAAAHVTKLNPTGTAILWSTYVGDAKGDGERRVILYGTHPVGWEGERLYHGPSRTEFPIGQSR